MSILSKAEQAHKKSKLNIVLASFFVSAFGALLGYSGGPAAAEALDIFWEDGKDNFSLSNETGGIIGAVFGGLVSTGYAYSEGYHDGRDSR